MHHSIHHSPLITDCMESKQFILVFALGMVFFFHSCVKDPQDIPAELTEDPVFGFSGLIDGQVLNIEAGIEGWTALPVVTPGDSGLAYRSILSKNICTDHCSPSLEFRFYKSLTPALTDEQGFLQTIKNGSKELVKSEIEKDSFEIQLTTHPGLFMSGYSFWKDSNNPVASYQPHYSTTIGYQENLNVCFHSFAFTGCHYTQCIYFDPATLIPCLSYIQPKLESARHVSLTVKPQGTPPFQIKWANGETSSVIVLTLQDSTAEIYAGVKVTDALGNYSVLSQHIQIQNGVVNACYFPISLISQPVTSTAPSFTADKVEIVYIDENNVEWKSTGGVQSLNASMIITDVVYYGLSPFEAQPAYKVSFSMQVDLFNALGEVKTLLTQNAAIPLSHP